MHRLLTAFVIHHAIPPLRAVVCQKHARNYRHFC